MHAFSVRRRAELHVLAYSILIWSSVVIAWASAADWPRFRGPNGSGISGDTQPVPTTWSPTENLKWKADLPGPGSSSPIVVGERVYVTCWSGYGADRADPVEQDQLRRHLVCLDRNTGKPVWSKSVQATHPEEKYQGMMAEHGYASHTPVSDGKRIYVYFGKTGALAFDLDGNQLWQAEIGTESEPRGWGSASSPILFGDILIVTATAECEAMVGLDAETGKELWRQAAAGFDATWGTPVLVQVDDQRTDLVIGVPNEIWGINPSTGKLRWYCEAMQGDAFCSSVVAHEDTVFAIEARGIGKEHDDGGLAVRAGGKGNVTASHRIWATRQTNRIGTPIVYEGRIYFITRGIVNCINAKTGEPIYGPQRLEAVGAARQRWRDDVRRGSGDAAESRPPGDDARRIEGGGGFGGDYASPVIADGKIYYVTRTGNIFVLKTGDTFELLAVNRVSQEREDFTATPAISDGQLFVRSSRHVYCIAFEQTPVAASPAAKSE